MLTSEAYTFLVFGLGVRYSTTSGLIADYQQGMAWPTPQPAPVYLYVR